MTFRLHAPPMSCRRSQQQRAVPVRRRRCESSFVYRGGAASCVGLLKQRIGCLLTKLVRLGWHAVGDKYTRL